MSLKYPLQKCWMKRGQQKRLPAFTGQHHYLHYIGAYNWRTDQVDCCPLTRKDSEGFIAFLEWIMLERYPQQDVILILDNASYHHSAAVQAAIAVFEARLRIFGCPLTVLN